MTMTTVERDARLGRWLRMAVWGGAGVAWLIPLAAKLLTDLPWTTFDFIAWGVMLLVAAGVCEVGLRLSGSLAYRAGFVVAAGTSFLIVWSNLAVGIIGNENNPLNQIFFGVIAVGIVGSFRSPSSARPSWRWPMSTSSSPSSGCSRWAGCWRPGCSGRRRGEKCSRWMRRC